MTPEQLAKVKTVPGWLSDGDIRALFDLASTINNGTIIELGSMHGKSANALSIASPSSKIFCLDYWSGWPAKTEDEIERPNTIDVFKSFTADCGNVTAVHLKHGEKTEVLWDEPIDMLFLDAAHTNPDDWDCITFWLPKIKKGGILCGHDYYTERNSEIIHYPDVVENIKKLETMFGKPATEHKNSCTWSFIL